MNGMENKVKKLAMTTSGFKSMTKMNKTLLGSMKNTRFQDAFNEELDPPSCINMRLVGHSFAPGSQVFIPMIKISPSNKVTFGPACVNEA
mmetsp:Transcript_39543/g.38044  ORF Transcript_39543/g.38044 Transcript_39543/m.38044 type:complete len:90 (+) Transcript_39543:1501-1770(+)